MTENFRPLVDNIEPREKKFKLMPGATLGRDERFRVYTEAEINTLIFALEKYAGVELGAQDITDLRADLLDNCDNEGEILDVIMTFLSEHGMDNPDEFLLEEGMLE